MADKTPAVDPTSAPTPAAPPAPTVPVPTPGPSRPNKRPASDMTEPADKKSRSRTVAEPNISGPHPTSSGGVLQLIANRFGTPTPIADTQLVVVLTEGMKGYFESLWDALVTAIYPDSSYDTTGIISSDDFVFVCRYLTKARIDHVYSSVSGRRPSQRVAIPRDYEVPKALADVINSIGPLLINGGAFLAVPQPEPAPSDAAISLATKVSYVMLSSFSRLIKAASSRGLIRTAFLSSAIDGTAWWLLTSRQASNHAIIADNANQAVTMAVFKEWTPADGVLCSIVQRGNDGIFVDLLPTLLWTFDVIPGIAGLRRTYNLDA